MRVWMREIEAADGCGGSHCTRFGQLHAEALGVQQIEDGALLGVIGTRRISGRGADAAIFLGDHFVAGEPFVGRVPRAADVAMQLFG